MEWQTLLLTSSTKAVIIRETWLVLMVRMYLDIKQILRTTLWINKWIKVSLTIIIHRLMAMACRLDHCFQERRHHQVKVVSYSHTILEHSNKHKTFILVWIRYYLKIHPMQHKLLLSKTFSTCQQMYKICSRIHPKHRTKLRGCFLHHKVLEWVTHLKPLLHFIVLASKIEAICDRQLSRLRKDLRILIIHYSLSNIIKILSRDNLPIRDHQSMSDLELFNNCSCKMRIWNKLTSQSQQLVIVFQENKVS